MADAIERNLDCVDLFSSLPPGTVRRLERECRWQMFDTGDVIIDRGEEYTDVYVLTAGLARVLNYSENGKVIDYATLGKGDIFGELAAIDGLPRSASVVTQTPSTMAVLAGDKFVDLIINNPSASLALLQRLAGIVRYSDKRINDFSLLKAEQRVCIELLRLAEPVPGNLEELIIHRLPTQSNIANSAGVARETVGRIFSRLARKKIIARQGKTLRLRQPKTLEQMVLF